MYVQSLGIEGFTSFKDVRWSPEPLNVLIGRNGSGKSNLLRALDLIRASAAGNLNDFVLGKGGFPRLLWGGTARHIYLELMLSARLGTDQRIYDLVFVPLPDSASFRVASELLAFEDPKFRLLDRNETELTVRLEGKPHRRHAASDVPPAETALSMVSVLWDNPIAYQLQQELKAWAIYQSLNVAEDAAIRRSAVDRQETRVAYHGQNLTPVLNTLYKGEFKEAIDSAMSAAFPDDFRELTFATTEPNRVQLYLRRKHGSRQDSAADLSDGTLRFLLLLTILATPDPPALIAIDEPEAGLHPSMLPIIAEFAVAASKRTQVILSTHSLQMLDAFGETLPAATIFSWEGDHTELKTATGDELKKWVEEYSLGRFIFSGEAAAVL
jgi:predicted ATPase